MSRTLSELWKTESLCSSQAERFRQQAVEGKLRRSGEWPISPSDRDDVHDGFSRSIWNYEHKHRPTVILSWRQQQLCRHGHPNTLYLEQLLSGERLCCDQHALVVAGHPGGCEVLIGQLDILPMVL